MNWISLPSLEALLESTDLLCIPTSRHGMPIVYQDLLSLLVPAATLPPLAELSQNKTATTVFHGHWKARQMKILVMYEKEHMTEACAFVLTKKMAIRAKAENAKHPALILHLLDSDAQRQAAANGWTTGNYEIGLFKNGEISHTSQHDQTIRIFVPADMNPQPIQTGVQLGQVQHEVMTLVNLPSSHKSPEYLGHWAQRSAATHGYQCEVLDKPTLEKLGMYALLAVNKGSEQPAQMIITHYRHPEATKKVALVGKGVLFDTGGLSIKMGKNMHYMKSDMGGAAAVLGTVEACARLGLPVDVMAIVPATDNSVDSTATKPGDVISSYAGKTIEVIDTDAEGRLILADALTYAVRKYQPDVMIDLATLTGSIVAAIGPMAAGLFTKNDTLAASLEKAGTASGERVWRMPMYDEYHEDMQSDIADIKNLSDKAYGGSITAAKFLEVFTEEHVAWAHLDIAGMAFQPNGFGKSYCATGYGVRLLVRWLSS